MRAPWFMVLMFGAAVLYYLLWFSLNWFLQPHLFPSQRPFPTAFWLAHWLIIPIIFCVVAGFVLKVWRDIPTVFRWIPILLTALAVTPVAAAVSFVSWMLIVGL